MYSVLFTVNLRECTAPMAVSTGNQLFFTQKLSTSVHTPSETPCAGNIGITEN